MFLNSFNHFRAIAIILIVIVHFFNTAGIIFDNKFEIFISNIVFGGTFLFVFISGFLFHHVFYSKFNYSDFLKVKMRNVLVPYTLLSMLPIMYYVVTKSDAWDGFFLPKHDNFIFNYIVPYLQYYFTGRVFTAYWYIPVVLIIFSLSPVHIVFINMNVKTQLIITIVLTIIAMLVHRSIYSLNPFHSVVYFMPMYLIGILSSLYKPFILNFLEKKLFASLIIILSIALIETFYFQHIGNYHKDFFEFQGFDFTYVQKILLCLTLMVWLNKFDNIKLKSTSILASTSFAIFFLHPVFILIIPKLFPQFLEADSWWLWAGISTFVIIFCMSAALITKKIFGRYSRYLIGY